MKRRPYFRKVRRAICKIDSLLRKSLNFRKTAEARESEPVAALSHVLEISHLPGRKGVNNVVLLPPGSLFGRSIS
ncbi:MAG: hypothetical protein ACI8UZ_003407 [Akkermansiaceae bacterium]|jgi:hypothetical protein